MQIMLSIHVLTACSYEEWNLIFATKVSFCQVKLGYFVISMLLRQVLLAGDYYAERERDRERDRDRERERERDYISMRYIYIYVLAMTLHLAYR